MWNDGTLAIVDCTRKQLLQLAQQESEDLLDGAARQGQLTLDRENDDQAIEADDEKSPTKTRPNRPSFADSAKTTSKAQLMELFTQAEGKCNWIPIEAAHKTSSRYMEFFLPNNVQESNITQLPRKRQPKHKPEKKHPCALCEVAFPVSSLPATVSRQSVYRLRSKWAKQFGSTGCEHVQKKYRFRLYDELRVCLFCSQLFNDFSLADSGDSCLSTKTNSNPQDRQKKSHSPKTSNTVKTVTEPIIVTVVGKDRLEEIFFEKLATGEKIRKSSFKIVRATIPTPLKDNLSLYGNRLSTGQPSSTAYSQNSWGTFSSAHQPTPPSVPKSIRTPSPSHSRSKAHPLLSPPS